MNCNRMAKPDIVEIEHLSHSYGERPALVDLSLRVKRGEIFGFLGPNGSGKTTLFRILCTLIPAPPATVKILGLDLSLQSRPEVRRQLGVVFQSPSLDKQLTAEENLRQQGHLYGLRGAELVAANRPAAGARESSATGGTSASSDFPAGCGGAWSWPRECSISRAILLLDEPSTGLDPAARIDMWKLLTEDPAQRRRDDAVDDAPDG